MMASITQYVLKVHSRCDLACDHCYVYEHADQSWRGKPRAISERIVDQVALRLAEHATAHGLPEVRIILHGGEPLLVGRDGMRRVLTALESRIAPVTRLDLRIHTNGVRLDEDWCALFDDYGVRIGVSLDGDQGANDRHRRFARGQSSYVQVKKALGLLRRPEYRHLYAGILCTIDIRNDPIAVYEALLAERPPVLDLLLPHATWERPPYRRAGQADSYAAWLAQIYGRWMSDGRPVQIRLFDSLISAVGGGPSWSEAVGLSPVDLLVIETDGTWEQSDSLKTAFDGAATTGMDVFAHSIDQVTRQPGLASRTGDVAALSADCRACSVVQVCGGGLYAHRYRAGTGFNNPSVYCADLKSLIHKVAADLPQRSTRPQPRARHQLSAAAFEALSAGPGDTAAVASLFAMRLSLTRALIASVADSDGGWKDRDLQVVAAEGWAFLCALDADQPTAVQEIMSHPYTQAWALRCLHPDGDTDQDLDRAHLASLAAAAALRAGITAKFTLPVRDDTVYLPTMGALRVAACPERTTVVSVGPDGLVGEYGSNAWRTVRRMNGPHFQVIVDDLDPFRDCHERPAAGSLSARQWLAWRQGLTAAGGRLAAVLPAYASVLAAGLRTVVPLRSGRAGHRCGQVQQPFGAVALPFPSDPAALDALLLHQFQHAKLDAVLNLCDLFQAGSPRGLRVPWGKSRHSPQSVMHDAYAHLALAHLSRSRGPAERQRYLRHRSRVRAAGSALVAAGALTSDGERFLAGMLAAATE
jgi:uncharacterized protein